MKVLRLVTTIKIGGNHVKLTKRTRSILGVVAIAIGAIIAAYGVQAFIVPSGLGGGGAGGIALLLYYTLLRFVHFKNCELVDFIC